MEEKKIYAKTSNATANKLFDGNNLFSSNTVLHFACLDYMKTYETNMIPFDFLRFYFTRFKTYDKFYQSDLRNFFDGIDVNNLDISLMASVYTKSITSIAVAVIKNETISFLVTNEDPVNLLEFFMESDTKSDVQYQIYSNIKTIVSEMDKSDELLSKKALFERFMIDKFLDNYTPTNIIKTKRKTQEQPNPQQKNSKTAKVEKVQLSETTTTTAPSLEKYNESMKGKETEVPVQKGKVTKLFIPKLMLPTAYPILQDSSRINSDYRTSSMLKADRMIWMFNKHKFKAVIYNAGFIEKRKKTKKAKPKFNFDF